MMSEKDNNIIFCIVVLSFSVTCLCFVGVSGKVYTRCGLAQELLKHGFPKKDLRNWVCLIEEVSNRNTNCKEGPKKKGMHDWGLFQISEKQFCEKKGPGKECNATCSDMMSEDITKAAACAKYIHKHYGFTPWDKYYEKCIYYLPTLGLCGIHY